MHTRVFCVSSSDVHTMLRVHATETFYRVQELAMAQNDWTMSWCAFKSRARAKLTGKDVMARSMTRRQRTAATRAHTSTTHRQTSGAQVTAPQAVGRKRVPSLKPLSAGESSNSSGVVQTESLPRVRLSAAIDVCRLATMNSARILNRDVSCIFHFTGLRTITNCTRTICFL